MNISVDSYNIVVENDALKNLNELIKDVYPYNKLFIVTDKHLDELYHDTLLDILSDYEVSFSVIEPGETSKSLTAYEHVSRDLIKKGFKKNHLLIAFGGGVVGDLTGFIAGTLYRGVPFIQVPTSLLAMVDSAIGGKTGINLDEGKNLLGVFKQPLKVIVDPNLLKTLPKAEYKNGVAEVIKAGLIGNPSLYEYLKTHDELTDKEIIDSILVKTNIVLKDPYEKDVRMLLNFGHTFGHAIERFYDYAIKHGIAISYGMLIALEEGEKKGITRKGLFEEVKKVLLKHELVREPLLKKEAFISLISTDKKQLADGLRFVLIKDVGDPVIVKGLSLW